MTRRRYVFDEKLGKLVEIGITDRIEPRAPTIIPDTPGYQSPVTGLWVEGRKARREDLKRTGSRPWEGMAAERKEADRQRAEIAKKQDQRLDQAIRRAYYQLSPEKRRILERGS